MQETLTATKVDFFKIFKKRVGPVQLEHNLTKMYRDNNAGQKKLSITTHLPQTKNEWREDIAQLNRASELETH